MGGNLPSTSLRVVDDVVVYECRRLKEFESGSRPHSSLVIVTSHSGVCSEEQVGPEPFASTSCGTEGDIDVLPRVVSCLEQPLGMRDFSNNSGVYEESPLGWIVSHTPRLRGCAQVLGRPRGFHIWSSMCHEPAR